MDEQRTMIKRITMTKKEAIERRLDYQCRIDNGETQSQIARSEGISRQAVHLALNGGKN